MLVYGDFNLDSVEFNFGIVAMENKINQAMTSRYQHLYRSADHNISDRQQLTENVKM